MRRRGASARARPDEGALGALRGRVGEVRGPAAHRGHVADHDDRAAVRQGRLGGLGHEHEPPHDGAERVFDELGRDVGEVRRGEGPAGRVDDAVEAAERRRGVAHHGQRLGGVREVGDERRRGAPVPDGDRLDRVARRDGDVAADRAEVLRDGPPQAAAAAADEDPHAVELHAGEGIRPPPSRPCR